MKYIGKRTCYCDIKDDVYLGSGTMFKQAVEKYGANNFEKEILLVCDTEEECLKKEEEIIRALEADSSNLYYNIAPGGAPRPDGFSISESELKKKEYLNDKMKNEKLCGARVRIENSKSKIELATITDNINEKIGKFTIITDDTNMNSDPQVLGIIVSRSKYRIMSENKYGGNMARWLHDVGYMLISEDTYNKYKNEATSPWTFNTFADEILTNQKKYFGNTKSEKTSKNVVFTNKTDVGDSSKCGSSITECVDMYADTSIDYNNFALLLDRYKRLGSLAVYNAITGVCAISGDYLKNGKLKCSNEKVKSIMPMLDYELKFVDIAREIGGRHDYLYMVIGFCFRCDDINNDELFRRLKKKCRQMRSILSLDDAVKQINYIYNYRRNNKVDITNRYWNSKHDR